MNKHKRTIIACAAVAALSACAPSSQIGLVDVQRIVTNWPVYQGYQDRLTAEERSISARRESDSHKQLDALALQQKYAKVTDQLSKQIRDAAAKIADQRRLKLVLTREGVGYGGVDITSDVEKALDITEKATPTPGN